jgi:hypothetical protein
MTREPKLAARPCHCRPVSPLIMADSDALRSKRKRLHAAGDCSLCRHDRPGAVLPLPVPGAAAIDPLASLASLAARLEAAHEADPADAAVARVLKDVLLALVPPPGPAEDDVDPLAAILALGDVS